MNLDVDAAGSELRLGRDGWLVDAFKLVSPNADARPHGCDVDLLVVHAISLPPNQFGSADVARLFTNCLDINAHPFYQDIVGLRVSAHFFISRGGRLLQFVSTRRRAWHAGVSVFESREQCNDFSIGVELEGCDTQSFTPPQYDMLIRLTRLLLQEYPGLSPQRIVGHSDIAPGRKTDPGPLFDWARLHTAIEPTSRS